MNIAVFADIHGRILLSFKVAERFQRETGQKIDLILQCGDMGIFPNLSKLDKATIRHADKDETELGFNNDFIHPKKEVEKILSKINCGLICVRGNHDDHDFLDELEQKTEDALFSVDCYKRIYVLKTGYLYSFTSENTSLNLFGIGRVGPPIGETEKNKPKYIQEYEQNMILKLKDMDIDILLTHDAARNFVKEGFGMEEIRYTLDTHKPAYHFFGHTGKPFERKMDPNGVTVSSKMSDFEWEESDRGMSLKPGCFGILQWKNSKNHSLTIVKEPWLKEYTCHTWKYL